MKIISWNCNGNLKNKIQFLEPYNADIIIIQEPEYQDMKTFNEYDYTWVGDNPKKGLGVLHKKPINIIKDLNKTYQYYIPFEFIDISFLATWSFNHRAKESRKGYAIDALKFMENWIDQNTKMIILGDFNHSVIWDNKLPEQYTFKNLNDFMVNKGFKSIYHQTHEEKLGSESCPTFYHQKNANKPFHIDYGYIKGFNSYHLDVGNYSDWIKHSDHMPLIMNIKDTN